MSFVSVSVPHPEDEWQPLFSAAFFVFFAAATGAGIVSSRDLGALGRFLSPVFITVIEKKDPYVPALAEVKDRVREDTIRAKAADLSRQRAQSAAVALSGARDFTAAAKALGLEAR